MSTIADWISKNANWAGDRIALAMGDESFTYAEMDAAITRRCHALVEGLGVKPGEHVAFLALNSCEQLLLLFACARVGCSLMPLNNRLAVPEHQWILEHSGARYLLFEPEFAQTAVELNRVISNLDVVALDDRFSPLVAAASDVPFADAADLESPVLLIYTSGTTGRPKGVVHQQRALLYNALNAVHSQEMRADDHVLNVLPLFHSGGLNIQVTPALYLGARVSLLRRFDPAATLQAIQSLRPTMFLAVPAVIQAMVDHPLWGETDLSCLRMVGTGSSNVPDALLNAWHDRDIPATQIYGLTESAPTAISLPIAETQRRLGAAGKPVIHCEARVVGREGQILGPEQRGEIQLRGPNLLAEYFREPELTAESFDGDWFNTGDIGHQDADGFYYIDDRKKDVIISGGENIFPAELENVLASMPELAEYAVIGAADERWGETTVACVVLREGAVLDAATLIKRFEGQLARFKHPRRVEFMDVLPRNAMGKVLKFKLREMLNSE